MNVRHKFPVILLRWHSGIHYQPLVSLFPFVLFANFPLCIQFLQLVSWYEFECALAPAF